MDLRRAKPPRGEGRPLTADHANLARTALGIDATQVRVHDGPEAATSADQRDLAAYTVGQDVVLGDGARGSGLAQDAIMAHELVHVAQQSGAARSHPESAVEPGTSTAEHDAELATPATVAALAGRRPAGEVRRPTRTGLALQGCPKQEVDDTKARIQALEDRRAGLAGTTATGSPATFSEVGAAFTELKDVEHDLAVARTGQGVYQGSNLTTAPSTSRVTDCTEIVFEVLRNAFAQQGRTADWAKVEKAYLRSAKLRGSRSGIDLQAALQSELGWKGIYWAPDPQFPYKDERIAGVLVYGSEPANTSKKARTAGTYYKGKGYKRFPGVQVDQRVTDYAPEKGSTTTKNDSQLEKLRKLPFGVMSASGAIHMTILIAGNVFEVHYEKPSTSPDVITQTPLEKWAIGPDSGIRFFTSGVIVAPPEEVDKAFK